MLFEMCFHTTSHNEAPTEVARTVAAGHHMAHVRVPVAGTMALLPAYDTHNGFLQFLAKEYIK